MKIQFKNIYGELNIKIEKCQFTKYRKLYYKFENKYEQIDNWFFLDNMNNYFFKKESFINDFMTSLYVRSNSYKTQQLYDDLVHKKRFELCIELRRYFRTHLTLLYVGL